MRFPDARFHTHWHQVVTVVTVSGRGTWTSRIRSKTQRRHVYDFYFNVEYVTGFNDQISHLHFSKISKYKIAENSNTDSKLQIVFVFVSGWKTLEKAASVG